MSADLGLREVGGAVPECPDIPKETVRKLLALGLADIDRQYSQPGFRAAAHTDALGRELELVRWHIAAQLRGSAAARFAEAPALAKPAIPARALRFGWAR